MRIPRSRNLPIDVLHFSRQVPSCAHDRIIDVSRLAELRDECPQRISWSLLFLKAYAMVAQQNAVLRQTWMKWPWPHIYQHPTNVAMLVTRREFRGAPWLFWARLQAADAQSLEELQQRLNRYQQEPPEKAFRRQYLVSGLPTPLRRLLWWLTLNVSGEKRAARSGTFYLSTIAGTGAEIQHPPAFLTSGITYGPLDENGRTRVTLTYDHRLMDGACVGRFLAELDDALNGPIAQELAGIAQSAESSGSNLPLAGNPGRVRKSA